MRTKLEILKDINSIYMQLSPENLWEDGMLTPAQARKKETLLMRKLSLLFKELGYEVDEYDIMTEIRNAQRMASSHTAAAVKAPRTLGTFTRKVVKSLQKLFKDPSTVSFDPKKTKISTQDGIPYYTAYITVAGLGYDVMCMTPVDEAVTKMPRPINMYGVGKDYGKMEEWVVDSLKGKGLLKPTFDPTPSVEDMFNRIVKTLYAATFSFKGKKYPVMGGGGATNTIEAERRREYSYFKIYPSKLELDLFGEWRMGMGSNFKVSTLSSEERREFGESLGKSLVAALEAKFPGICDLMGGERHLIQEVVERERILDGGDGGLWAIKHEDLQKYIASKYA